MIKREGHGDHRGRGPAIRDHLPMADPDSEAYWAAAKRGVLLIKRCGDCHEAHFYPRPFCPYCWSNAVKWEAASGEATVYSFSVVRRNDSAPFAARVPYVVAVVRLAEGPAMVTNIVGCDPDDVHIDMPVVVTFRADGDCALPVFAPLTRASHAWPRSSSGAAAPHRTERIEREQGTHTLR